MFSRSFLNSKRILLIIIMIAMFASPIVPLPEAKATSPTLSLQEWQVPSSNAGPWGIAVDSYGKTWFTENVTNRLGMLDPTTNTFYEMNTPSSSPRGLAVRTVALTGYSSSRVFFTEGSSNKVAFFDNNTGTPYRFTEYQLHGGSNPVNIAVDDQGVMYFPESGRDIIGVLDPSSNTLTEWTLPGATTSAGSNNNLGNLGVWGISVQVVNSQSGTNRLVWFTELLGDKIGRLNTSTGQLVLYDISTLGVSAHHSPAGIVATPATCSSSGTTCNSNQVFFSSSNTNQISVIGPTDTLSSYNLFGGIGGAKPTAVAMDSANNRLWFPESNSGNIGFIDTTFSQPTQIVPTSLCTLTSGGGNCPQPIGTTAPTVLTCNPSSSNGSGANQCTLSSPSTPGTSPTVNVQGPGPTNTLTPGNALNGAYEYPLTSTGSQPQSVTLDASGNVWVAENANSANKIGRVQVIPNSFQVTVTSASTQTVTQGQSATFTVSVSLVSGAASSVQLSVNAPSGLTDNFNPASGTPTSGTPFTSTLTIFTSSTTTPQSYPMTITGTGGGQTNTAQITLIVNQVTTSVSSSSTSGVASDFQISVVGSDTATVLEGSSATYGLDVAQVSGTAGTVTLSPSGLPTGATASFNPASNAPNFGSTLTVSTILGVTIGTFPITITASGESTSHTVTVTLVTQPQLRDFTLSFTRNSEPITSASFVQGARVDILVTVNAYGVFNSPVTLAGAFSPSDPSLTAAFSPSSVTPPLGGYAVSTLEIVAQRGTPGNTYQFTVTATDTTGKVSPKTYQITISISPCLIATATYGSELSPEVQFLRNFRDQQILRTFAGSSFMDVFNAWYYSFSPAVAQFEYSHETTRTAMKEVLYPLIGILHVSSDSYATLAFQPELAALTAGIVASFLIGLAYVGLPAFGILCLAKEKISARTKRRVLKLTVTVAMALFAVFIVAELLALASLMMIASVGLILTVLFVGGIAPAFGLVRLARREA
ncbi:MAG: CFI-box-CTERM domain-containing protein [Candidatus Bathyarchaeia archaeon]